jgi:hypothetical protein
MSKRKECGTPCNGWQLRLYSCKGCLFRLRDTFPATAVALNRKGNRHNLSIDNHLSSVADPATSPALPLLSSRSL